MNFSIIGYWITKHSKLIFPVIYSDDVQTDSDFTTKILNSDPNIVYSNNSTLSDFKGTVYGDMLADALSNEPPTSGYFYKDYKIIEFGGHTYRLNWRLSSKRDVVGYIQADNNYNASSFNYYFNNNIYAFPNFYNTIGIIYIPQTNKLGLFTLDYRIGNSHEVRTLSSDYSGYGGYRITELNVGLNLINEENGTLSFGPLQPSNPFDPIIPSGPNTPGGKFDDQSDIIVDSSIPFLSASDTGFTRIYIPTLSQVQDLARYLWTDETVVETIWNKIKQFFENPMEAIIGFNLVPVSVPSSGTKSFALMYIDTGVDMDTAANQFVDVDCGTFKLEYYYGSALDYSPYTKVSCFLPYIGMVQLNTDEVMNRTLQIKYRIDIVSGSCVAKIFVDGNCIYQYSGHCAITIPISASDFTSYVSAAISVAKLAVGAAVGGAAGTVSAALQADVAQQTGGAQTLIPTPPPSAGAIIPASIGSALGPVMQQPDQPSNAGSTSASFSGLTPKNISNTVGEIMGSKPHVQHSGSFSGNSGYLGVRRPFLIIERPNLCLPENYQQLNGFPAMITMLLGECNGYTRVQQVELTGLPATNPEQAEILELLKSGVIF